MCGSLALDSQDIACQVTLDPAHEIPEYQPAAEESVSGSSYYQSAQLDTDVYHEVSMDIIFILPISSIGYRCIS